MDYKEFKAKSVEEAVTAASIEFGVTSELLDYEVIEKGSNGFLGIGAKLAVIKARVLENEKAEDSNSLVGKTGCYLDSLFKAMDIEVKYTIDYDEENYSMNINLEGPEMGILIGKRGQTLDALQYLIGLYVRKENKLMNGVEDSSDDEDEKKDNYIHVKLDTENYRARRKDTLENLAKNIAFKVKRSRRSVTLEPMNPYERRIIHSALQGDKYVATRSEGEEPYRKVVVYLKK